MPPLQQGSSLAGSFRIFAVAGVTVYIHWAWLVVAYLELQFRTSYYELWIWNVAEYLTLFGIVLLHEFGHALACRQVGGRAEEIVLWPLGGIAFVQPPARPGAVLWSIAAGPLVNLVLVPITVAGYFFASAQGLNELNPDADHFLLAILAINLILLIFNMLPIYPLDGGQILQSLLWFFVGRATSLMIVCVIGMIGVVGFIVFALLATPIQWWFLVIAAFAALRCWAGFRQAQYLAKLENAPRHLSATCPSCESHPPKGPYWQCDQCGAQFDTFAHQAECPNCGMRFGVTACLDCQRAHPIWAWYDADEAPVSEWEEPRRG